MDWNTPDKIPPKAGDYLVTITRYGEKIVRMARWIHGKKTWKFPSAAQGEGAVTDLWSETPKHPKLP